MIKRTSRGIQEINFKIASHGDVNRHIRLSAMKDYSELDPDDEVILTHAISDEALESAAGAVSEKTGAFTLAFCSGLDTCPA
jgi:hypothetical protein